MSSVVITVGGTDRTSTILFAQTSFDQEFGGVAGTFTIVCRDPDRTLSFSTGAEVSLTVDGVRMFGGYVTQVSMGHMAAAADASNLSTYQLRTWTLRGSDYNIIFDKRVWRNTSDYLSAIEVTDTTDGGILRDLVDNFSDCSDFTTTGIDDIVTMPTAGDTVQQGTKLRSEFESIAFFGGAIWYIDGNKNFIYKAFENVEKRWGFSDRPNNNTITASPASYQGATHRFREVEATEDGTFIVNDALVWGGSQFAGPGGGTVFSRTEDSTSESTYGRWQMAETHFGERKFSIQDQVDQRSSVIVNGPPGADIYGQQKGLRYSQWQFTFTWQSVDVPLLSGVPDHLIAGDIVTIDMETFGVTKLLPMRTLHTSFPDALVGSDPNDRVVQFQGTFGLQLGDPFTLWRYVIANQDRVTQASAANAAAVNDSSSQTIYGAIGQFTPTPTPNGSATVFTLPFGYVSGSLQVYKNGLLLTTGTAYTESDNVAGQFTMAVAPLVTDTLIAIVLTLNS